jgi:transposase
MFPFYNITMKKTKRLTNKQFRHFCKEFKELVKTYSLENVETEIDWVRYERKHAQQLRYVARELNTLVKEAMELIVIKGSNMGRKPKLSLRQKIVALLLKSIFNKNNRPMAGLLSLFGAFIGVDIGYKTIERLYSNEFVRITLHNMFVLTVKRRCGKTIDVSGDGTGYSLTVTKHYRTEGSKEGSRDFVYSFNIIDVNSQLYVGYGSGIVSEKEAFKNATKMLERVLKETGIILQSARLDRYYSYQSTLEYFDNETVLYILPKSNTKINGPSRWRNIWRRLMKNPLLYLIEYYRRENSESGFSVDKRMFGWKIWQKRDERIDTAVTCIAVLHNLFRMGYG